MLFNDEIIFDSVLHEVGEGRLSTDEAVQELREAGIELTSGSLKALLAFEATSILVGAGFDRNGF